MADVAQLIKNTGAIDAKGQNDTLRLWENYREQATLWRILAIGQLLTTPILVVLCLYLHSTRVTEVNVPEKPLPGHYPVGQIPDSEYIEFATEIVNLIATYQPYIARKQFRTALEMLREPALTQFNEEMMVTELKAIENTQRTQVFFVDPLKTEIKKERNEISVSLEGGRIKFIAGKQLTPLTSRFVITMTTIPRNKLNKYGIVATRIRHEAVDKSRKARRKKNRK